MRETHVGKKSHACGHVRCWNKVMNKAWWSPRKDDSGCNGHQRKTTLGGGGKGHTVVAGIVHQRVQRKKLRALYRSKNLNY